MLSAPTTDESSSDSTYQHSAAETRIVDGGKTESDIHTSVGNENAKPVDINTENNLPEIVTKDETNASVEQKSADDGAKEEKASSKNELALAFANRFAQCY